ncbi:unnamed protein product [Callosobruchus maculatus]|uniref:Uncharacterized protein n=1 Tax=Callosobruchus maculatus TaxID=64391 RepID=A0A653D2S5_CALMS|nr:unnamed protein product [Callosobruchus maculatus]
MEKRGRKSGRELKFTQAKLKYKFSASKGFTDCVNNVACPLWREHYNTPEWIRCHSCATRWHEECTKYSGFGEFVCDFC